MITVALWCLKNWKVVAAVMAIIAVLGGAWWLFDAGRDAERASQDKASLSNLRDRSAIDDEVRADDDVSLCLRLGGGAECRGLRHGRR